MLTLPKCYSALVASGNGAKCNELKQKVNSILYEIEPNTQICKVLIFKIYNKQYPDLAKEINHELSRAIENIVLDVKDIYFGNDLKQIKELTK